MTFVHILPLFTFSRYVQQLIGFLNLPVDPPSKFQSCDINFLLLFFARMIQMYFSFPKHRRFYFFIA